MKGLSRFVVLLVLLATRGVSAQPIQVNLDHAAFAYSGDASLLEIYLAFASKSLHFEEDSAGYRALLPIDVALVRSTEATLEATPSEPVWRDSLLLNFVVADTSRLSAGQQFVHQVRAAVPPGEYELQLQIPENPIQGRSQLDVRRDVLVSDFAGTDLVGLSDLALASSIQRGDDRGNPFYKNGLIIQPNANQLYGQGLPDLFYYAEAYNVDRITEGDGQYTLYAYVSEANRPQPIGDLQHRAEREARSPDVIVGSFDLSKLPSGSYFLRMAVLNEANESVAEQARKFFVYNPNVQREAPVAFSESFETSPYASMTQAEVDQAYEHLAIIASDREKRRYQGIRDLDEQRRFLMSFWQQRDPQPSTPVNEFKEEFYRRLQYANDRYSSGMGEGWQSDRGRVVLKYGMPSNIEPHLYDRDSLPYEIWQYNNIPGEGQALFVFADRGGFGQFEMIHATVSGERSLPNWQQELRR